MTVTEIKQSVGSWDLRLRNGTPRELLDKLTYYGHLVVAPGRLDVAQYGDSLLGSARYVGVYLERDAQNEFILKGGGMAFWLGDTDEKGDMFETPVDLVGQTFAASVRALLPPGGAVVEGTLYSVAGTYTGKHQWVTPRKAITYVTDTFNAEWRVNYNGTLDAGTVSQLYNVTPKTILMQKQAGADLLRRALPGRLAMNTNVADYTTRVVLLAEGEGTGISTGEADAAVVPYKDLFGNTVRQTRVVSESETAAANADARAQLALNAFSGNRSSVTLSSTAFDIKGDVVVGDYVDVYDPLNGFIDPSREVNWEGQPINPIPLRCVEMTWPIPPDWTVAFRTTDGEWIDLSPYYAGETGETQIRVGELPRSLSGIGGEGIGIRPNLPDADTPSTDTTIPGIVTFTGFSTGVYETLDQSMAAIQATWAEPLNVDSSTITDGDHYEIRFRPNAIIGTPIPWDLLSGGYALDYDNQFTTTVAPGSWGTGWALVGTGSEFSVSGDYARIIHTTHNTLRGGYRWTELRPDKLEIRGSMGINYQPAGASTVLALWWRVDSANYYWWRVEPNPNGTVTAKIWRYKASVWTELASVLIPGMVHAPGTDYHTKATLYDGVLSFKVWQGQVSDEPEEDNLNFWDQDPITGSGSVGFYGYVVSGATNPVGGEHRFGYLQARSLAPDNVGTAYSWDDLGTWDAPTSEPVAVTTEWSTAFIGWDQLSYLIAGLGAGIKYELQIRAVDSASPPHSGAWSPSSYVDTSGDVIAPSIPAAPVVAASMIAVQIEHRLGKSTGGSFNLELDLAKLEVHASHTATFQPSADTKVGDLIATGAMVRGQIPAVGSFKVDQAGSVWIKVVAVDRMGNSSGPSDAVQSSVELIDDAHITSLTVSKLTAGTITATSVLAASMEVGAGGNIRVTDGSFDAYDGLGNKRIEVGQLPDGSFDLAAFEPGTGAQVNLAQLAFGTRAAKSSGSVSPPTGGSYVSIPGTLIENVYVGTSGRVLFFITASANLDTYTREGFNMTVRGYGPGGASLPGLARLGVTNGIELAGGPGEFLGGTFSFEGSIAEFEDGLTPGYWDFWLEVRNWSSGSMDGSTPGDPYIGSGATLIVMPF